MVVMYASRGIRIAILGIMLALATIPASSSDLTIPWWKQQKIVFMWGQWNYARVDKNQPIWGADLPQGLFRNIALSGATVFAELRGCKPNHASFAHALGMKYFATQFATDLPALGAAVPGVRRAVTKAGESYPPERPWCPLDERVYRKLMVEPYLHPASQGIIDGLHIDWEFYSGGEAGICYCDSCFSIFMQNQGIQGEMPEATQRYAWLETRDLVLPYEQNYHTRRQAMFRLLSGELRAVKPDFLISSYDALKCYDFGKGVHTPDTPFIYLDPRHYGNDDRQPWWESYSARFKQEGYLYIPGGWTNALFGAQASQVSAARWLYEAAVNEDGVWLWFERELDDEILRAYAAASREIKAAQLSVGKYLLDGTRDPNFVTAVEWTGRPELSQAIITRTYHLGQEYLLHISNVDTEWPMRVRLRLPRLTADKKWTVRDMMGQFYYTRDGKSAVWTTADLLAGVVVAMEPRSDQFLLISPAIGSKVDTPHLLPSREFEVLPDHNTACAQPGSIERYTSGTKTKVNLYVMKNSIYDGEFEQLLAASKKIATLPKTGWRFRWDKYNTGAAEAWFDPATPLEGWEPIETECYWGTQGGIASAGWYRAEIDVPELPEGKHIYLHFGAVDEELVMWIDGKYAGDHRHPKGAGYGWDKPFAIDVTGKLTRGKHHLALRVWNDTLAGGICQPVTIVAGPDKGQAAADTIAGSPAAEQSVVYTASQPMVYTATEPMGLEGAEGSFTIGNTIRISDEEKHFRVRQLRGHLWSPSYSPDGRKIVFVHDTGGRGQIYIMNENGSNAINISNNTFCDRFPVWSPDGTKIAFFSDRTGDWDIYVMNADGGSQQKLAGNVGLDRAPAWSPDGKRIAWESHTSGIPNIWVCDADGQNSHPLIPPDKPLRVQRVENSANKEMRLFNFVEEETPFPDNTFELRGPAWSPDGMRVAAIIDGTGGYGGDTVLIEADGSHMIRVSHATGGSGNLAWSPNGKRLAGTFRTPLESERSGIFTMNVDRDDTRFGEKVNLVDVTPQGPRLGGGRRHDLLTWYSHGSAQPRRVVKTFGSLVWSPDGNTLAFSSDMDATGAFYVYTISAAGGSPTKLEATQSAWPSHVMWKEQ